MGNSEKTPDEGLVILIDKEQSWTSFDVVKKLRGILKVKKIGHAGTLDPLATGLLIICAGKKTKSINEFQGMDKTYSGIIEIGKTTPSYDLETEFDSLADYAHVTTDQIYQTAKEFSGTQLQYPPVYSAIKIDGKRAYKFARRGEEVKIEPKEVRIESFEISKIELPEIHFKLVCSKGFYVRSLANDFGKKLGVGAYLKYLRREKIGEFSVEGAPTIREFEDKMNNMEQ